MNYGLKVDVWALGVVMYGLLTSKFPFNGKDSVNNKKIVIPARAMPECGQLLQAMLERNEDKRISAQDALAHQFCKGATTPERQPQVDPVDQTFEIEKHQVDNCQLDRQDAENQKKKMMTASQLKNRGTSANPLKVVHHGERTKLQLHDLQTAAPMVCTNIPARNPWGTLMRKRMQRRPYRTCNPCSRITRWM